MISFPSWAMVTAHSPIREVELSIFKTGKMALTEELGKLSTSLARSDWVSSSVWWYSSDEFFADKWVRMNGDTATTQLQLLTLSKRRSWYINLNRVTYHGAAGLTEIYGDLIWR